MGMIRIRRLRRSVDSREEMQAGIGQGGESKSDEPHSVEWHTSR